MKILSSLLLSVTALSLFGCATGGGDKDSKVYIQNFKSLTVSKAAKLTCTSMREIHIDKSWKKLVEIGNSCARRGEWKKVEKVGTILAQQDIKSPWAGFFKSITAEAKGNHERALWMIEVSLKMTPNQAVLLNQKGRLLWEMKKYDEAVSVLHKAVKADQSLNSTRIFLAQIELRDQQYSVAHDLFKKAVDVNPNSELAHLGLADCLQVKENWQQVVTHLDKAIYINRKRMSSRLRRAWVLETQLNNKALALEAYRKVRYLKLKKRLNGQLPNDIEKKIATLEAQLLAESQKKKVSQRNPAAKEEVAK